MTDANDGPEWKEPIMLIPQTAPSEPHRGQGCPPVSFAELRRQLARPNAMSVGHRQRLLDFVHRLARVRALGDEYARVDLSEHAAAAMMQNAAVV